MRCTQVSCGYLLVKTPWPMLFPPGTMPGEMEGQEFTVLDTKEQDQISIRRQPISANHRLKWGRMKCSVSFHLSSWVPAVRDRNKCLQTVPQGESLILLVLSPHTPSSRKAPCLRKTSGLTITESSFLKSLIHCGSKAATVCLRPHVSYSVIVTGISPVRASSVYHTTSCLFRVGEQSCTSPDLPTACSPIPSSPEKETPTHLGQLSTQSQLLPGTAWFQGPLPEGPPLYYPV